MEIRQISLIDMAYAKPDELTLLALQTFADWQEPRIRSKSSRTSIKSHENHRKPLKI